MERLKRRSEFRAAAAGMRASGGAFVVQARRRNDAGPPRVGFTVSKQVGNAVERNRVRRRLREMVRLSADGGAGAGRQEDGARMQAGHDYVLIGRRAALAAPFAEMMQELAAALGRIHGSEPGGTGAARRAPLHETRPPPRPQGKRRTQSPKPSRAPSQASPADCGKSCE